MSRIKPLGLSPQDKVAVVAPAGPFDRPSFEAGLARISQRYAPAFSEGIFAREDYLAGDDERRFVELQGALEDPSVRAIFAARGGYGSMRLLSRLRPPSEPKLLVGFSDLTAVHAWLQREGQVSIHGPVLTQLGRQPAASVERLFRLLESSEPAAPLTGAETWVAGRAEGTLVGGNLAMLSHLQGTPFLPPLRGAILLLEDVGERPYKLDRLWTHLELAGVFQQVAGVALGTFTGCEEKDADFTSQSVLRRLAERTGVPCASGFEIGHGDINLAVPLGVPVRLDADAGTLEFLEGACR